MCDKFGGAFDIVLNTLVPEFSVEILVSSDNLDV